MTERRNRPGSPGAVASTPPRAGSDSTAHRSQDGYLAPAAEDRLDAAAIDFARSRGFRVAVQCTRCGQWVTADTSVALHMGPVCRAKTAEAVTE